MNNDSENQNSLEGIPGIGPARRTALAAAGITRRAELARATIEQLVSVTGMPRTQAEQALAFVQNAVPQTVPEAVGDEAMPEPSSDMETSLPLPDAPEETPLLTDLDRALFAARTALSDMTRVFDDTQMEKPFARLANVLDTVTARAAKLPGKRQKRLTSRLQKLTERLERAAAGKSKLTPKRRKLLREQLREGRRSLSEAIAERAKKPGKA